MSNFHAATVGSATGAVIQTTGETIVLPASSVDDLLLVYVNLFTWDDAVITDISCTATSGNTWTKVGTLQSTASSSSLTLHSVVYTRKATSGDSGDTLVFKIVGTHAGTDQEWWASAAGSYTGFPGGVDAHSEVANLNEASPYLYPAATTVAAGCWAVYFGPGAVNAGGSTSGPPAGATQRSGHSNSGIVATISDSNGSVGGAGTGIGNISQPADNGLGWGGKFTISISPVASAITGTGSIQMHKMGLSISGHAPLMGTGSVRMHKMGISIQAHIPGTGSIRMHKMAISSSGHAPLRGTGSVRMHKMAVAATGSVGSIIAVFNSTDGNGVDTYDVTSAFNGPGTTTLRVLNPTGPTAGFSHVFLYTLAVELEGGTTFGNGLDHVRSLGAPNAYNLTVVEPSFKIDPWFADNPANLDRRYETYMVKLVAWVKANLATSGSEKHVLIGFSKSGIGGQDLILNNPTVFDKCISWDFPADMTSTVRFDPDSTDNYGADPAFANRYELDATSLAAKKAPFLSKNRLYIDGGTLYTGEVSNYAGRLTTQAMLHTFPTSISRSHAWDSGWVAPALASVITQQVSGTGSIRMHKMGASATGHAPVVGTGSISMHKMRVVSAGTLSLKGTGSVRMHKMRIVTPNFSTHSASEIFVFTDV